MSKLDKGTGSVAGKVDKAVKVRKSTKGVPRITDKILAMDEAGRAKWLADATEAGKLSATVVAEIQARLVTALAGGRTPKKVNFAAAFTGRTYAELVVVQGELTAALKAASVEEEETLNRIIAKAEQQKAEIAARKAAELAPVEG